MSAQGWAGAGQCNIIAIDSILTLLTLSDDDCDTRLAVDTDVYGCTEDKEEFKYYINSSLEVSSSKK